MPPTSHAGSSTPGLSSSATVAVAAYLATAFLLVLSSNGKLPKLLTPHHLLMHLLMQPRPALMGCWIV